MSKIHLPKIRAEYAEDLPVFGSDLEDIIGAKIVPGEDLTDDRISALLPNGLDDLWTDARKKTSVNENNYAKLLREYYHLQYNNGIFYTREGRMTDEMLAYQIWQTMQAYPDIRIDTNVERTITKIINATKIAATVESMKADENIIPFANGDFYVNEWEFHHMSFSSCPYRFPIKLKPNAESTPFFDKWMDDLFTKEDQEVVLEFMAYCLIPSTKCQKALFLVGEGGTGKSVIGVILESILGGSIMSISNTAEFLEDKFKEAELENKLVLYDDDLDDSALSNTGKYKKLITNTISITAERKFRNPFTFKPFARLISCCNEMLSSETDNTEGFWRRLLPILVKPKAENFEPDLHFYEKISAEAEDIAMILLLKLKALKERKWELPVSSRTVRYLATKQSEGNPFPQFLNDCFEFGTDYRVSTKDIVDKYNLWRIDNSAEKKSAKQLQNWLVLAQEKYGIHTSTNIPLPDGKRVRGYVGMKLKDGQEGTIRI